MQLLQLFKDLTLNPKNAHELKDLILKLAIQGKLTGNWRIENPDVEPASELFKRINGKKEVLIKSKKIRVETAKKEFQKDAVSFSIPETWVSKNITEFYYTIGSKSNQIKSKNYNETGKFPIVSQGKNRIEGYSDDESKLLKITNPVIVFGDHTRLIKFIDFNFIIGADGTKILNPFDGIDSKYFYLHSSYFDLSSKGYARHYNLLKQEAFCLPPMEEQKEIVKVVEILFKEVEQLEQLTIERIGLKEDFVNSALNQLTTNNTKKERAFIREHFKNFFNETSNIKKLRETVLQLAVQGKLTADWRENNPDAEGASILLKRIQTEKAQLIKDKKIKKEKTLPPISKDEVPYELPDGWVWCRMIELCQYITDGTHQTPKYTEIGRMFISAKNVKPFKFMPDQHKFVSEEDFEGYRRNRKPELNDILLTRVGAGIGEATLIDQDLEFAIYVSVGLLKMFPKTLVPEYLVIWLNSPEGRSYSSRNTYGKGVSQGNLNLSLIRGFAVSFPPLEEQKAIVQKVNALMGLCDALEQEVQQSQEQIEKLMQSCLREVFEEKKEELAV